jgi:hypothetical protein
MIEFMIFLSIASGVASQVLAGQLSSRAGKRIPLIGSRFIGIIVAFLVFGLLWVWRFVILFLYYFFGGQ